MASTTWTLFSRVAGVRVGGQFPTEAAAQAARDEINASYAADHAAHASAKHKARWAHLNGQFFSVVSPEQQDAWALVEFSR